MPAIPLTNNFIPAFNFQEVLIDKTTGFPLAKGIVTFYEDEQRTTLKNIYQLTGIPGNYTVTQLPNPIALSSVGTFEDNSGNDIIPYFYPYDLAGNVEYYYVTVYSSLDGIVPAVLQFTREHVPYVAEQDGSIISAALKNYIPNGQFLVHNNVVNVDADPAVLDGEIYQDTTYIAPNGWTYERDTGSTATDIVNFVKIPITAIPVGNPTYTCNVTCILPSGTDTFKYLAVSFGDVNKFANDSTYTFAFSAKAISAPGIVTIKARKNYGTGGSAEEIIDLGLVQITTSEQMYNFSFSLGSNIGKNLGADNTDFCSFMISFFPNQTFNFQFTDFILAQGTINFRNFPVTTNTEFLYSDIAGSTAIPDYNAQDLYLPQILTPAGLIFDHRSIGNLIMKTTETLEIGELWADGSQYDSLAYSSDGIPYSRLADKWVNFSTNNLYQYGTGHGFFHATNTGHFAYLENNSFGAVTHAVDVDTGFTFTTIQNGDATHYYKVEIACLSGSLVIPGSYFFFHDLAGNKYYVWYQVGGIGTDPMPPGCRTGILISILSTDSATTVANSTANFINERYFAVPDYRGFFPRFWNMGRNDPAVDPDYASRIGGFTNRSVISGDHVGTEQFDQNLAHVHPYDIPDIASDTHGAGTSMNIKNTLSSHNTGSEGGNEARSTNMYVGAAILY